VRTRPTTGTLVPPNRGFGDHSALVRTEQQLIILGVILLIVGLLVDSLGILVTIGLILIAVGVVLALLGRTGRAIGGRKHWF
jgi:hypothetical protein